MTAPALQQPRLPTMAELNRWLAPYQKADTTTAVRQLANTLLPYAALWVLAAAALKVSFWLALPVLIVAGLFLVRIFIMFHDCGHNSFFPSTRLNRQVGFWLGVLVLTPGEQWWKTHAIHHATSGNLDKRGLGDVETLTLEEYRSAPSLKRLGYRFFRNPLVMFGLGPLWVFVISSRFPQKGLGRKEHLSVLYTNLGIIGLGVVLSLLLGWQTYLIIQLAVSWIGGALGIWMFYVQHQFPNAYWARNGEWNYVTSALKGASYYALPKWLAWFTGNIGYHHIHHLSPRVPNYRLALAHQYTEQVRDSAVKITLRDCWRTLNCKVWDEDRKAMVPFPGAGRTPAWW